MLKHTEVQTPLDKIRANLSDVDPSKRLVVLISTGSIFRKRLLFNTN
jgi:hypothetical protein